MESVAFIQWCLDHLNYWTITLLMTIESSFIPFPSEVVIPPAAYKAAVNDELNIYLVVLFATIGANIGALINYYLAKWLGRPIIYKFANSRIGHMCLIDEEKVRNAEIYFDKHGALSTFIGRLIPAVRQLISFIEIFGRRSTLGKQVFSIQAVQNGSQLPKARSLGKEVRHLYRAKDQQKYRRQNRQHAGLGSGGPEKQGGHREAKHLCYDPQQPVR